MRNLIKNIAGIILIFLLISAVFSFFSKPFESQKEISLTQLAENINQETVKKITVSGMDVSILYNDQTKAITKKEADFPLSQSLLNYGVSQDKLKRVEVDIQKEGGIWLWLGPIIIYVLPLLLFVFIFFFVFKQAKAGTTQAFNFTKAKARLFGAEGHPKEKITFKDVAGLKEAKEELQEIIDFLKNPKKYLEMGARIPKGVLLVGSAGTGKTLLARATAGESNVPFISIAGASLVELFVGVGASRIRDAFLTAKKHQPCIVFFDELDSIGKVRSGTAAGGHEEREQTLNQLLTEMDGFEPNEEIIILAASVTGDTPVLIKKSKEYKLAKISEVIDSYYKEDEENIEKPSPDLEILGFNKRTNKNNRNNLYFGNSSFKKVRSVFRHKVKEIYEIEYRNGKIKATGNHSVFIRTQQGLKTKAVAELKQGDVLAELPFKANRTSDKKEIRSHIFNSEFNLELPLWQPLFEKFETVNFAYQYALSHVNEISQTQLGRLLGFSQRTIGKWQHGICGPRVLSRNYYQHKDILPETVKVTPDLMRLMGYYVAEGYSRKEIDFCLNIKEIDKIDDIKILMKKIFNLEPNRLKFTTPNAINIVYYSKPLANFFSYYCGKGAKNKHVPYFLFETPFEYFQEFFRGYFNGDGHLCKDGKGEATSVSKQLILELNWLFSMHGYKSYIHSFKAKEGRKIKNGKPLKETIAWKLGFGKTQNPLSINDERLKGSVYRPVIKKITKIPYEGYVYDFCGCENEAFFGGERPVLLHNTNRPDVLDPALLRPGRFDRKIVLDPPDINDREEILKIHSKNKPLSLDVKLREIAERTPGFTGADLANVANESALLAARKNKKQVAQLEFLESIEKVLLGPERKSHILSKKEKEIAAFHETGHALVSTFSPKTEPVRKISIIARGMAAGYTLQTPSEEKRIKSKTEFLSEIATLLGGYTAEKLKFKEITTGASNDLTRASSLARKLVKEYGMSSLGPISFGEKEELMFLGGDFPEQRNYSEKVATLIDKEVEKFIKEAEKKAASILLKKKDLMEKIAKTLIEKETIEKEEFESLVKDKKPSSLKIKVKKGL